MKIENTKLEDIKALVKRGMSFAVALALAGTMSACDEPNLPDETTDPSFGITEPSDTTPGNTETTNPGNTETNPGNNETEKEPEPLSPELQAKYPAISEEEYKDLIEKLSMTNEAYKDGIEHIDFIVHANGNVNATFYYKEDSQISTQRLQSSSLTSEIFQQILEIAEDEIIELNPADYNMPDNLKLYDLYTNETNLHKNKISAILNIIYEHKFQQSRERN